MATYLWPLVYLHLFSETPKRGSGFRLFSSLSKSFTYVAKNTYARVYAHKYMGVRSSPQ